MKTYLSGGLIFTLFVHLCNKTSAIERLKKKTGICERTILEVLNWVFLGSRQEIPKEAPKCVTNYKQCLNNKSVFIPFTTTDGKEVFTYNIENDYQNTLQRMICITHKYIDKDPTDAVRHIVKMIEEADIEDDDLFHVLRNGRAISKTKLLSLSEVEFQPFMLGVFYYATLNVDNTLGVEIYKSWFKDPTNRIEGNYNGPSYKKIKNMNLKVHVIPNQETDNSNSEILESKESTDVIEEITEENNTATVDYVCYKSDLKRIYSILNDLLNANNISIAIAETNSILKERQYWIPNNLYDKIYAFALDLFSILDPHYTDATIDISWCKNPIPNPKPKPDIYALDISDRIKEAKSKLNTFFGTEFHDIFY